MSETNAKTTMGLEQNIAGLLCYVGWWVTGIIFLVMEKENQFVRFHAVQSIVTFGAISIAEFVSSFIPVVGPILSWVIWVLSFILWIVLMLKANQGQMYKLPIAGNFAENQIKRAAK